MRNKEKAMEKLVDYILGFLLGFPEKQEKLVGYTADKTHFADYKVVIVPSDFFSEKVFGTVTSLPTLPLSELEGIPVLFGLPKVEKIGETLVCYADLVASSFFLLSRYEELLVTERDEHGRFSGKFSLPYRAGFLSRPIVDEYGQLLRSWLRDLGCAVSEPTPDYSRIVLTHDVDFLYNFRHFRGLLGGIKRAVLGQGVGLKTVAKSLFSLENDPAYTFPWLLEQDKRVPKSHTIVFVKAAKKRAKLDYPHYSLTSRDAHHFFELSNLYDCEIGLHASYASGVEPALVLQEKERLQSVISQPITSNRHHYLRIFKPEEMDMLLTAGITDDYTLGYADVAGFRLGTCRPVKWINPITKCVTELTLHPLTVMDCTLSNDNYMALNYEQALDCVQKLLLQVKRHGGEAVLLWHNTVISDRKAYHKELYAQIINFLAL